MTVDRVHLSNLSVINLFRFILFRTTTHGKHLKRTILFKASVNTTQYGKRTAKFAGSVLWKNLPPPGVSFFSQFKKNALRAIP